MVLTFRNLHNWVRAKEDAEMIAVFYRTLKPGGVLGLVDHRAKPGTSVENMASTGYVTEQYAIDLVKAGGFEYEGSSPVNSNAADSADHPDGVWSLPPSLRTCKKIEIAAEKAACEKPFLAIGESDRMTLRFRKPH
jgi:predicted methyltransferase